MNNKQPMTREGKALLEVELKRLVSEERPAVIKAIEEARSLGDLSENADYEAAKERQAFCEARIAEVKSKIAQAEVIDASTMKSDTVIFGATVNLKDVETGEKVTYKIVGEDEANVKEGKISVFSPLARAMIGKRKGKTIIFHSPKGEKEYDLLNFSFK